MAAVHKSGVGSSLPGSPPPRSRPEPGENHLLAALSEAVQARLLPHLELVSLAKGARLCEAGRPMRHVYFPIDAVLLKQILLRDGHPTALTNVGNEGLLSVTRFLGLEEPRGQILVQSAGHAFRLPVEEAKAEFDRHDEFHDLVLRFAQALISEISQTAVCNRHHSIDQQLCRWLLLSMDRLPDNHLAMTQEDLSHMLGVRREGVTEAASRLRAAGFISYARGHLAVLDRFGLEQAACECYELVRSDMERILRYLPRRRAVVDGRVAPVIKAAAKPTHH